MNLNRLAALVLAVSVVSCVFAVPAPAEVSARLSRQLLATVPEKYLPPGHHYHKPYGRGSMIHYAVSSLWVNALACARLSGNEALEKELVAAFTPYFAEKRDRLSNRKHVDHAVVGAIPLEIARLTGDEKAKALGLWFADRQWEEPRPEDIGDVNASVGDNPYEARRKWWAAGYTDQTRLWIDDMYMITLLQSEAYKVTKDRKYIDRAAKEQCLYLEKLQREDGLFNHSDTSFFVWGRGDGWMAAAMPMILEDLDEASPFRAPILSAYRRMMETLLRWQRDSGLWGQIVDDPESWEESSCSAMFAFAFETGYLNGWLGKRYHDAALKAYAALVAKVDGNGNLADTCEGTGATNARRHYLNRKKVLGDPHGQCALLWLCKALLKSGGRAGGR